MKAVVTISSILLVACTAVVTSRDGQQKSNISVLRPVDEGKSDAGFSTFRDRFIASLKARDLAGVRDLVSADLPGLGGRDNFLSVLGSGSPEKSMWNSLLDILTHGGAFTTTRGLVTGRREFCAPYWYAAYPDRMSLAPRLRAETERLPWAIVKANAVARVKPAADAAVAARLSYNLIDAAGSVTDDWVVVTLASGRDAFVNIDDIRDPLGPYACFAAVAGKWQLVTSSSGNTPR